MQIVLVGIRDGETVINWPGVVVSSVLVALATIVGAVLMWLSLDGSFSLLPFLIMSVPILLVSLIGVNVKRALKLPPEQLTRLV